MTTATYGRSSVADIPPALEERQTTSLVIVQGPGVGLCFPLVDKITTIGRQVDSTVFLPAPIVSRRHARIVFEDGLFLLEDAGSCNGTFVNGHRIAGQIALGEGDSIEIGPYRLGLLVEPAFSPTI